MHFYLFKIEFDFVYHEFESLNDNRKVFGTIAVKNMSRRRARKFVFIVRVDAHTTFL